MPKNPTTMPIADLVAACREASGDLRTVLVSILTARRAGFIGPETAIPDRLFDPGLAVVPS